MNFKKVGVESLHVFGKSSLFLLKSFIFSLIFMGMVVSGFMYLKKQNIQLYPGTEYRLPVQNESDGIPFVQNMTCYDAQNYVRGYCECRFKNKPQVALIQCHLLNRSLIKPRK